MTSKIDWEFIGQNEGWSLNGYVPNPEGSQSGVTVANGFDLGAHLYRDLVNLRLPTKLCRKLDPYLGRKKLSAQTFLHHNPLSITQPEGECIRDALHCYVENVLSELFDQHGKYPWKRIPAAGQTIIASVAYQYGLSMKACPMFRKQALNAQWSDMLANLRDFGDDYPTRRNREADYLEAAIKLHLEDRRA